MNIAHDVDFEEVCRLQLEVVVEVVERPRPVGEPPAQPGVLLRAVVGQRDQGGGGVLQEAVGVSGEG